KSNVQSFMTFLQTQKVDFHLGVTTTDTYDPAQSGRLQNLAGNPVPWVGADGGLNIASDFVKNAGIGELGTGDEKGLLGGMMALTAPLSPQSAPNPDVDSYICAWLADAGVECFLRQDAALSPLV